MRYTLILLLALAVVALEAAPALRSKDDKRGGVSSRLRGNSFHQSMHGPLFDRRSWSPESDEKRQFTRYMDVLGTSWDQASWGASDPWGNVWGDPSDPYGGTGSWPKQKVEKREPESKSNELREKSADRQKKFVDVLGTSWGQTDPWSDPWQSYDPWDDPWGDDNQYGGYYNTYYTYYGWPKRDRRKTPTRRSQHAEHDKKNKRNHVARFDRDYLNLFGAGNQGSSQSQTPSWADHASINQQYYQTYGYPDESTEDDEFYSYPYTYYYYYLPRTERVRRSGTDAVANQLSRKRTKGVDKRNLEITRDALDHQKLDKEIRTKHDKESLKKDKKSVDEVDLQKLAKDKRSKHRADKKSLDMSKKATNQKFQRDYLGLFGGGGGGSSYGNNAGGQYYGYYNQYYEPEPEPYEPYYYYYYDDGRAKRGKDANDLQKRRAGRQDKKFLSNPNVGPDETHKTRFLSNPNVGPDESHKTRFLSNPNVGPDIKHKARFLSNPNVDTDESKKQARFLSNPNIDDSDDGKLMKALKRFMHETDDYKK